MLINLSRMQQLCLNRFILVVVMDSIASILITISTIVSILFIIRDYRAMEPSRKDGHRKSGKYLNIPKPLFILMATFTTLNISLMINYALYQTRCDSVRSMYTFIH